MKNKNKKSEIDKQIDRVNRKIDTLIINGKAETKLFRDLCRLHAILVQG